ncbi:MAG: biotin synthase BioB [Phycisphaeraceae bacterium]|nr:biotin synthase BioB [Phycisphaeraceae bacterium]
MIQKQTVETVHEGPGCSPLGDRIFELGQRVLAGHAITREEAMELTSASGQELYDLFYWANRIRVRYVGPNAKLCSIIAGRVGACSEDCAYCSQSKHYKTHVTPSRAEIDDIQSVTDDAINNMAGSFGVVNAGRGPTESELDRLEPYYRKLASEGKIRPCATLGELSEHQVRRLVDMGVERINHNLETSRRHFPSIVTTHSYEDRLNTLRRAKSAGLSLCCGGIFGLGENWDDRLDMAMDIRELGADVVPINFLYAIEGTPMGEKGEELEPMEALKIVAIFRFILPDKELKIAGGRGKILRDMQSWSFFAGASSMMIGNYLTTFNRDPKLDHQMFRDLGLKCITYDEQEVEFPAMAAQPTDLSLPILTNA